MAYTQTKLRNWIPSTLDMRIKATLCILVSLYIILSVKAYIIVAEQSCLHASNGDRPLPNFIRPEGSQELKFNVNPIQAIIASYRFNCCGLITEWRAFVHGSIFTTYTISFQVWSPISNNNSCYNLTGINHFSRIPLASFSASDRGIVTGTVSASERVNVQPGDVIGFHLKTVRNLFFHSNGIQFAGDNDNNPDYRNESVWSLASPTVESPTEGSLCAGPHHVLSSFTDRAPLITVTVCK